MTQHLDDWKEGIEPGGRCPAPSHPIQGRYSKKRIAGRLREEAGPCPDHMFLNFEVRRPANYRCAESFLGGQKGSGAK